MRPSLRNFPCGRQYCLAYIFLYGGLQFAMVDCLRWLSFARIGSLASAPVPERICDNVTGLVKRQVRLCKTNLDIMDSVRRGAALATEECQFQFRHRLWNCSSVDTIRLYGTREAAFVHAISSAAIAHAVTRACSTGELKKCQCDQSVRGRSPEGYQWSGCSDNIAFGSAFSQSFVDSRERIKRKKLKSRALMNLHNNQAGRKAIEFNMRVECKCHGVSGSCQVKTCWRSMPPFRQTGNLLKEKFDGAMEVMLKKNKTLHRLEPLNSNFKFRGETDLVYLDTSPDFCSANYAIGSLGTKGRRCNATSPNTDGCDLMCCGRGYSTQKFRRRERCKCSFHWCCEVRCKECTVHDEIHTCL